MRVWAEWTEEAPSADPGAPPGHVLVEGPETRTDGGGRYALCGVPPGRDVIVRYAGAEGLGLAEVVHLDRAAGIVEFEVPDPEAEESGDPD